MKTKRSLKAVFCILLIIFLVGFMLSIIIYTIRSKEPLSTVTGYLINSISLVTAIIALVIAMITYFTIDSVNSVTSMEGNVLENYSYSVAYSEMVMQFRNCRNQTEFMDLLMDTINDKSKNKTSTCIQFADWIQIIIDHLIWFAYVDFNNKEFYIKCEKLVFKLEKECDRYNSLSNGIQYLLKENVKLIKYVLTYKQSINLEENRICYLENIRGKMISNPISQIIYYNYLGLDYRKKASKILNKCQSNEKEFSYQYMKAVSTYNFSEQDKNHFYIFIDRAKQCFHNASKLAEADVLWDGYIKYNEVRLKVMEYMITQNNKDNILKDIREVINIREMVCFLFDKSSSFLDEKFMEEHNRSIKLYESFENL